MGPVRHVRLLDTSESLESESNIAAPTFDTINTNDLMDTIGIAQKNTARNHNSQKQKLPEPRISATSSDDSQLAAPDDSQLAAPDWAINVGYQGGGSAITSGFGASSEPSQYLTPSVQPESHPLDVPPAVWLPPASQTMHQDCQSQQEAGYILVAEPLPAPPTFVLPANSASDTLRLYPHQHQSGLVSQVGVGSLLQSQPQSQTQPLAQSLSPSALVSGTVTSFSYSVLHQQEHGANHSQ